MHVQSIPINVQSDNFSKILRSLVTLYLTAGNKLESDLDYLVCLHIKTSGKKSIENFLRSQLDLVIP